MHTWLVSTLKPRIGDIDAASQSTAVLRCRIFTTCARITGLSGCYCSLPSFARESAILFPAVLTRESCHWTTTQTFSTRTSSSTSCKATPTLADLVLLNFCDSAWQSVSTTTPVSEVSSLCL
ncbi:hypothetical protein PoB_003116000 [Plakobranchus ocellatus]|uniref:Uncharacterized protein n=1 Tax=Plakobranchus ocellatus TaxID=259542 RepID=A0AAV4AB90_9GAST|nr:hypothetical protein PoB_003116000 [Plakobranchus ocellatus]